MLTPTTYGWTLFALVLSMICLGSWANLQKATGKHRFELFYYDFSIGALVAAILMAISLGMMGNDLTFEDNIAIAGKRNMGVAMLGGGLFNLANMLLLAGISISGMSVAMPISLGLSVIITVIWGYVAKQQGSPALLFGGVAVLLAAIVANAIAHHGHALATKPKIKNQIGGGIKGIAISVASGILMGLYAPLIEFSRLGDIGLGPYAALVFMTLGIFFTTFLYNLYFMNLPVQGEPVKFTQYFAAERRTTFWDSRREQSGRWGQRGDDGAHGIQGRRRGPSADVWVAQCRPGVRRFVWVIRLERVRWSDWEGQGACSCDAHSLCRGTCPGFPGAIVLGPWCYNTEIPFRSREGIPVPTGSEEVPWKN